MTSPTTTGQEECENEDALGGGPSATMVDIIETSPPGPWETSAHMMRHCIVGRQAEGPSP